MGTESLIWTTFILALLGAGAWIPTILRWLEKPDFRIVPGDSLEVSYMEYGGVLNLPCSFAAFRKAALVESFSLRLTHESGHVVELFCVGLSENAVTQSSAGEHVSWGRQSRVNTLAVGSGESQERLVMFRDKALKTPLRDLWARVVPTWARLKEAVGDNWRDEVVKTAEYDEWRRTVADGLPWRRGKYTAEMTLKVSPLRHPQTLPFEFELSEADVRSLQSNIGPAVEYVSQSLMDPDPPAVRPSYAFAWPDIRVG